MAITTDGEGNVTIPVAVYNELIRTVESLGGVGILAPYESLDREETEIDTDSLSSLRAQIEAQYLGHPTGCGNSFGEILCYEIHENGLTFVWLAKRWGVSLPTLGWLIYDHCNRLEQPPVGGDEDD